MTTPEEEDVPTTEPIPENTTSGASLVPDLAKLTKGVIGRFAYWIGALPGAPREHLDVGGVDFPKMVESVRNNKQGRTKRREQIGSIRWLNLVQIQRIQDSVPYQIIRFGAGKSPGGPGDGLEVLDEPRRKGTPMRIPSNAEVEKGIKHKRPPRPHYAEESDEPVARYVFMQLCADQDKPQRSDFYPESLEVTGLEWPAGMKPKPEPELAR